MSRLNRPRNMFTPETKTAFTGFDGDGIPSAFLYDDFNGALLDTAQWAVLDVSAAGDGPTCLILDGVADGILGPICEATSEAQTIGISFGDVLTLDVSNSLVFECRVAALTASITTAQVAYFGMVGDDNGGDPDGITVGAYFKWDSSMVSLIETDDTTNDESTTSGVTSVVDVYEVFTIDFRDLSDVGFYIDGVQVGTGTTYDMSNLTAAEKIMQPSLCVTKTTGTTTPQIGIDYVKIWSERG